MPTRPPHPPQVQCSVYALGLDLVHTHVRTDSEWQVVYSAHELKRLYTKHSTTAPHCTIIVRREEQVSS